MKNLIYLFAFAILFIAASCGDDEAPLGDTGSVDMNWLAVYGDDPLVMTLQKYDYLDGQKIKIDDFNFFISNVTLVEESNNDEVELIDIEYVNFAEDGSVEDAQTAKTFSANLIPVGNYSAVRIGFGVPDDLNKESSTQLGSDHPLVKGGTWWADWDSYIFTRINGTYDIDGNGDFDENDAAISHHLGGDFAYKTITFDKAMVVEAGKTLNLDFLFDIEKFYSPDGAAFVDLTDPAKQKTHNLANKDVIEYLIENWQAAITISVQ